MGSVIEHAKSGRAKCRKCREKIEKDELRFGHEVASDFGEALQWYHLSCAARKIPVDLEKVLKDYAEDVPGRDALEQAINENRSKQKPTRLPWAELAPSGRSSCQVCEEKIAKGEYRIAIEREIDAGGFVRMGAGYLHPKCSSQYEDLPEDLEEEITENSISLTEKQLTEVKQQL